MKVALTAMALGIRLYIIPLGMIANPDMLRLSDAPLAAFLAAVRVALGLTLLSSALCGRADGCILRPLVLTNLV